MRFGKCRSGEGIRHVLRRLNFGSFQPIQEMEICVRLGCVDYLVPDHRGDLALCTWRDAAEWGYVVANLSMMSQLPGGFSYPYPTMCSPDISPDDRFVVSCNSCVRGWWAEDFEDYEHSTSSGGLHEVGTISVHDIVSDTISHHMVMLSLPEGWMPDRPDHSEWSEIWGPEFVSERTFRIWLPDDSPELLTLPLPERIEIHRPIATERRWLDK
jgi:hypothetical protein